MTNNTSDSTADSSMYYTLGSTSGSYLYSRMVYSSYSSDNSSMNRCDRSVLY